MAHVKNAGGGPGDEDPRRLPHLPTDVKGKAIKKLATKKRKYADADTERAAVVVATTECAEEVLGVVLSLQISFHQHSEPPSNRLSVVMVVQLGQPWLEDGVSL